MLEKNSMKIQEIYKKLSKSINICESQKAYIKKNTNLCKSIINHAAGNRNQYFNILK